MPGPRVLLPLVRDGRENGDQFYSLDQRFSKHFKQGERVTIEAMQAAVEDAAERLERDLGAVDDAGERVQGGGPARIGLCPPVERRDRLPGAT